MSATAILAWAVKSAVPVIMAGLLWWLQNQYGEIRALQSELHDFRFVQGQVLERLRHLEEHRKFYGERE